MYPLICATSTDFVDETGKKIYLEGMLSPEQSRAGRGWLDWTQDDLAKKAGVALSTVRDFEKGRRVPVRNNLLAIRHALEQSGITFEFDGNRAAGITAEATDRTPPSQSPPASSD